MPSHCLDVAAQMRQAGQALEGVKESRPRDESFRHVFSQAVCVAKPIAAKQFQLVPQQYSLWLVWRQSQVPCPDTEAEPWTVPEKRCKFSGSSRRYLKALLIFSALRRIGLRESTSWLMYHSYVRNRQR